MFKNLNFKKKLVKPNAVLLDTDNTLYEYEPAHKRAINETSKKLRSILYLVVNNKHGTGKSAKSYYYPIGGKTGINSVYGKNLIGTFYQPIAVLTDVSLLQTLNKREILSGYAEIVKHSIIKDKVFFQWLEKNGPDIIMGNNQLRIEAIIKSCRIKRSVVEEDEFEKGNRALLNLGHTFGHAIEGYLNYDGTILHGEAVSIGIIMALKLSVKMGYCSKNDYEKVLEHFNVVGLPTSMKLYTSKIIDPLKLWKIMQNDKKMYKNHLNFILPDKIGKCTIRKNIEKSDVLSLLNEELRT